MGGLRFLALSGALAALALVVAMPNTVAAEPCAKEIEKYCPDVPIGGGQIIKCLNEHREHLSPTCEERMRADAKKVLQVSAECLDDVHRFCNDVEPGQGRILACLLRNETDLAPECQKHMEEGRQNTRKRLAGACAGDIETFCKEVRPGGGRIERCLEGHKDELSKGCVEKMKTDAKRRNKRRAG